MFALGLSGCANQYNRATTGALTGSALGAGLGAIIGSTTGHAGPGIAIGAAAGALGGALLGNSFDSNDRESARVRDRLDRQQREIDDNERLLRELRERGADARMTKRGVVVNLPDVLFGFDRAELTPDSHSIVREISSVLKKHPNTEISVEGHTDAVGSDAYNDRLSERRARAVASELDRSGVDGRRIRTRGFGESRPIASNNTAVGRERNRRVEVVLER